MVTVRAPEIWYFFRSGLAVDFMQCGVLYERHPLVPTIGFDEDGLGRSHAANPTVLFGIVAQVEALRVPLS